MVEVLHIDYSVRYICDVLGFNPSSFYYQPKTDPSEQVLHAEIETLATCLNLDYLRSKLMLVLHVKAIITLLILFALLLPNSLAQEYTQLALPNGAKARLGKAALQVIFPIRPMGLISQSPVPLAFGCTIR